MGNVSSESETEYWLSVVDIRESLAESEEDIAAGRTYGEAEMRALLVDRRAE
jgi:PHD/YefM family antitoxin component YafN of YafNO toxin-antitoxin module